MWVKALFFLFIVGQFVPANSDSNNDRCWTQEKNSETRRPYSSAGVWEDDVTAWKNKPRPGLNPLSLLKVLSVYSDEKAKTASFKNDKIAHCYLGCTITQKVDFKMALYVAWYKEMTDLTDCQMNTHFEYKDYTATVLGAEKGKSSSVQCDKICPTLVRSL